LDLHGDQRARGRHVGRPERLAHIRIDFEAYVDFGQVHVLRQRRVHFPFDVGRRTAGRRAHGPVDRGEPGHSVAGLQAKRNRG